MITKKEIKKVIEKRKKQIGIDSINSIKISRIGTGESNLNFLVKVNNEKLLFRIALRKKVEKNMKKEFESLKKIPADFGPKPIYFDNSKKIIPKVYSILEYIEGKKIKRWNNKNIKLHFQKLAQLHKKKYSYWGRHFKQSKKPFNLYDCLIEDIKDFTEDSREALKDEDLKFLIPKMKEYIKSNDHLFTKMKKFSLCHRDPCLTNILLTKKGIRYIDWEYAAYWDNAYDLAMFFDPDYETKPWRLKLKKKKVDYLLNIYLRIIKDKTLKKRLKVWHTYLKFDDVLFFKWKVRTFDKKTSDLPKRLYVYYGKKSSKVLRKILK